MKNIIDDGFIAMLEGRDLRIHRPMNGMFGGNRRAKVYGSSTDFADYREYQPGDDLRRIDKNLFRRFDKFYLKLFTDERQLHHRIYIDASASMDWGEPTKGYAALRLAAAFGYLAVQATDRVSYALLQDRAVRTVSRPFTGREAFYEAAKGLNTLSFTGESDIGMGLLGDPEIGTQEGLSIILSDFLTDSDWKKGVDRLLLAGRDVQLVQVLARDELTPAVSGKLMLRDTEASNEEDARHYRTEVTRSSLKAYEEALLWLLDDIQSYASSRGIGYFTVCSDESIEKMLFLKATEADVIQ